MLLFFDARDNDGELVRAQVADLGILAHDAQQPAVEPLADFVGCVLTDGLDEIFRSVQIDEHEQPGVLRVFALFELHLFG